MLRALALLLLVLNLVALRWGWIQDEPVYPPLTPLAQARGEILLGSEWSGRSARLNRLTETPNPLGSSPADLPEAPGPLADTEEVTSSPTPAEPTLGPQATMP